MKCINIEPITENKGVCTLISEAAPESLTITGADVDEMPSGYVFAAGSVLITASANYIAFTDGTFTQKG